MAMTSTSVRRKALTISLIALAVAALGMSLHGFSLVLTATPIVDLRL